MWTQEIINHHLSTASFVNMTNLFRIFYLTKQLWHKILCWYIIMLSFSHLISFLLPSSAHEDYLCQYLHSSFCFPFENSKHPFGNLYAIKPPKWRHFSPHDTCVAILFLCAGWCSHMLARHSLVSHWHDSCCLEKDRWRVTMLSTPKIETSESQTFIAQWRWKQNIAASDFLTGQAKSYMNHFLLRIFLFLIEWKCCRTESTNTGRSVNGILFIITMIYS